MKEINRLFLQQKVGYYGEIYTNIKTDTPFRRS